jgi:peptide-methionine (R)-S-oxide reductase
MTNATLPIDAQQAASMTEADWKSRLSPIQYHVLREAGTERAFTGAYWDEHRPGVYRCAACDSPLFSSTTKFESGTGWPSFYAALDPKAVVEISDNSYGMRRVEVRCANCGGHLGHLFNDGPRPTGMRYCMNSVSLRLEPSRDESEATPAR